LRSRPIDLVILDMMMPVIDGHQFRAEPKLGPALAEIPIVVVSAASPIPEIDAAETLSKPVDLDALLSAATRHSRT